MKFFNVTIVLLLHLLAASYLNAQKLYTWTDKSGVVHITDQPPPKQAKVEDVITYKEKTPQEIDAIRRKKEDLRRGFNRYEKNEEARQAEIKAREAEKRAKEAVKQAKEEYESNSEYIKKLNNSKQKRRQFRKRIQRLKNEAEASQAKAQTAVKQAEEAAQRARLLSEDAEETKQE